MKIPEDKETMRSFLEMMNFLDRFLPSLATLASPLQTHPSSYRICDTNEHHESFTATQKEVSNVNAHTYFDPKADTILWTDASKKGLGAAMMQQG